MKEYETKIIKAETILEVKAIIDKAETDENITDEQYQELYDLAEEVKEDLANQEEYEYDEWDEFDDMWHSGEFE